MNENFSNEMCQFLLLICNVKIFREKVLANIRAQRITELYNFLQPSLSEELSLGSFFTPKMLEDLHKAIREGTITRADLGLDEWKESFILFSNLLEGGPALQPIYFDFINPNSFLRVYSFLYMIHYTCKHQLPETI